VADLERRFADLVAFAKGARREGKPLGSSSSVRYALADLATELQTAKLLSYRVVWMQSMEQNVTGKEAPLAKLYYSELVERFASTALDILGQYGLLEGWSVPQKWVPLGGSLAEMYRDARTGQIAAGTSEIQRNVIAQRGMGLPRA